MQIVLTALARSFRRVTLLRPAVIPAILLCAASFPVASLPAQQLAHRGWAGNNIAADPWWKHLLLYRLDPLSFQDADGDGFGDLRGVADRLDYLSSLHIDALVLSPFELRPNPASQGESVAWDPRYGSAEDLDRLEQEAARRGIRLLIDLPLDGARSSEQTLAAARFWLSRGIAGLWLTQNPGAPAIQPAARAEIIRDLRRLCTSWPGDRILVDTLPGSAPDVAHAVRKADVRKTNRSRISRPGHPGPAHSGAARPQPAPAIAQLSVDPLLAGINVWTPATVRGILTLEAGTPSPVQAMLEASDTDTRPRSFDLLGAGLPESDKVAVAKQLATLLFTGRAAPALLFGQEIGLARARGPASYSPTSSSPGPGGSGPGGSVAARSGPGETGAAGQTLALTPPPMQWGGTSGFSSAASWIERGPDAASENVAAEAADPASLLAWYRTLAQIWHTEPALHDGGTLTPLETGYADVLAWLRRGSGPQAHAAPVIVVCNLSAHPVVISLDQPLRLAGAEPREGIRPLALAPASPAAPSSPGAAIALAPRGVYLGELRHAGLEDALQPPLSRHRHGR